MRHLSTAASSRIILRCSVLDGEIRGLRVKFEEWQGLLSSCNTATDVGFRVKHEGALLCPSHGSLRDARGAVVTKFAWNTAPMSAEFQKSLTKTEEACRKLKTAVANIQKTRARFPHVDDKELERRRVLVNELDSVRMSLVEVVHCRLSSCERTACNSCSLVSSCLVQALNGMRNVFYGRDTKARLEADQRKELHSRAAVEAESAAASSSSYAKANSEYMREQAQAQQQIRREQDETLGALSGSLVRVNEMAVTINSEIKEQDKLLDDIGEGMDEAQGKMDAAIKRVEKLLKTKDRCQLMTILILVVVFIIVGIIAFYTLVG